MVIVVLWNVHVTISDRPGCCKNLVRIFVLAKDLQVIANNWVPWRLAIQSGDMLLTRMLSTLVNLNIIVAPIRYTLWLTHMLSMQVHHWLSVDQLVLVSHCWAWFLVLACMRASKCQRKALCLSWHLHLHLLTYTYLPPPSGQISFSKLLCMSSYTRGSVMNWVSSCAVKFIASRWICNSINPDAKQASIDLDAKQAFLDSTCSKFLPQLTWMPNKDSTTCCMLNKLF